MYSVKRSALLLLGSALAGGVFAQEPIDQQIVARIKAEAFQNSKVMDTVTAISDDFGSRLTGSASLEKAGAWCRDEMGRWGLSNAHLEEWGSLKRGWTMGKYSAEMTEPSYLRLNAIPEAWSAPSNGVISGNPVLVDIKGPQDYAKYRGKLKGAIVFRSNPSPFNQRFEADAKRWTADELRKEASAMEPGDPKDLAQEEVEWAEFIAGRDATVKFLSEEGIACLVEPTSQGLGIVNVTAVSYTLDNPFATFPAFAMSLEHYGRIARLLAKGSKVSVSLQSDSAFSTGPVTAYNVIAELPGSDPKMKDEVVMLGGHLDSWHAATGATDNAAGCAAVMEALRILKAIGARPKRTIRVALWSGEEQDYFGSVGYLKKHYGDPLTGKMLSNPEKIVAYYNLDNGAGKIRGIYLQGNEMVRPMFEAYLAPFAYVDATTVSIKSTGGTDHVPFDALGIPAFQFIQDALDYETKTHHTNLDTIESIIPADLQQAAAIIATFAYHTANRAEPLPRKR